MSALRRVVFDTSSLVGAALLIGIAGYALQGHPGLPGAPKPGAEANLGDPAALRPKFDRYQPREVRRDFVELLRRYVHLFAVAETDVANTDPSCRNPKDNKFLALAKVCSADVLISSDVMRVS